MKARLTIFAIACCVSLANLLHSQGGTVIPPEKGAEQKPARESASKPSPHSDTETLPTLSAEEQYQLLKLRALRDIEDEIIKWAQTRFWVIAVLSILVGFVGVRALVREMLSAELKDAMRASADAQAAAGQGREAIRDVRAEAAKYKDLVEQLQTTAK